MYKASVYLKKGLSTLGKYMPTPIMHLMEFHSAKYAFLEKLNNKRDEQIMLLTSLRKIMQELQEIIKIESSVPELDRDSKIKLLAYQTALECFSKTTLAFKNDIDDLGLKITKFLLRNFPKATTRRMNYEDEPAPVQLTRNGIRKCRSLCNIS